MADINIYGTLKNVTNEPIVNAEQVKEVDIKDYIGDSSKAMPLVSSYVYNGYPISHIRTIDSGPNEVTLLFCVQHKDGKEDRGHYYDFRINKEEKVAYWEASYEYYDEEIPSYILKAFGETEEGYSKEEIDELLDSKVDYTKKFINIYSDPELDNFTIDNKYLNGTVDTPTIFNVKISGKYKFTFGYSYSYFTHYVTILVNDSTIQTASFVTEKNNLFTTEVIEVSQNDTITIIAKETGYGGINDVKSWVSSIEYEYIDSILLDKVEQNYYDKETIDSILLENTTTIGVGCIYSRTEYNDKVDPARSRAISIGNIETLNNDYIQCINATSLSFRAKKRGIYIISVYCSPDPNYQVPTVCCNYTNSSIINKTGLQSFKLDFFNDSSIDDMPDYAGLIDFEQEGLESFYVQEIWYSRMPISISSKQDKLISGANIAEIDGYNLLDGGKIEISDKIYKNVYNKTEIEDRLYKLAPSSQEDYLEINNIKGTIVYDDGKATSVLGTFIATLPEDTSSNNYNVVFTFNGSGVCKVIATHKTSTANDNYFLGYISKHNDNYLDYGVQTIFVNKGDTIEVCAKELGEYTEFKEIKFKISSSQIPVLSDLMPDNDFPVSSRVIYNNLTNIASNFISKSDTTGLVKNDGTIDLTSYLPTFHVYDTYNISSPTEDNLISDYNPLQGVTTVKFKSFNCFLDNNLIGYSSISETKGYYANHMTIYSPYSGTLTLYILPSTLSVFNTLNFYRTVNSQPDTGETTKLYFKSGSPISPERYSYSCYVDAGENVFSSNIHNTTRYTFYITGIKLTPSLLSLRNGLGEITGITMNGVSKGTAGDVNLGNVVTSITFNGNTQTITNGNVNLTTPTTSSVTSGSTTPITSGGVYTYMSQNFNNRYEPILTFTTTTDTNLNAKPNYYYVFTNIVSNLSILLPSSIVGGTQCCFCFTTGSSITFSIDPNGEDLFKSEGFIIESDSIYEVIALYDGARWLVTATKFTT